MNKDTTKNTFLRERIYQDIFPEKPSLKMILKEWFFAINIFKNREAVGALSWFLYCLAATWMLFKFLLSITTVAQVIIFIVFLLLQANIFHTFWYHRYASHNSFTFKSSFFKYAFKYLNPLAIKEEIYVIPHFVHHRFSDTAKDPYGPHIGGLASFLSSESQFYFNKNMSELTYKKCLKLLSHIPAHYNNWEQFKQTGSFEPNRYYLVRLFLMITFWFTVFILLLGQTEYFYAFFGSAALFLIIMRDFNYRGHDEKVIREDFERIDHKSKAVNQVIYGFLASEWHENHHRYSSSAKCGFEKWQLDISYLFTEFLKQINILESARNSQASYDRAKYKKYT